MVIRLVAHGDLLLPYPLPELALHEVDAGLRRRSLVLEDPTHVIQETCGAGQEERTLGVVHVFQEILGVLITLRCRQREPSDGFVSILGDVFPQKIQLAEHVLRILISLVC